MAASELMNLTDLAFTPALNQAHLVRHGELSPLELTELYLERIERLNPLLGSYFTVIGDRALDDAKAKNEQLSTPAARQSLPPFFGVPISVKDLDFLAGVRCTFGCQALSDYVAPYDSALMAKIKQAGFIILGKTATSEFGSLPYTEADGFAPARNPWHLDYTPGGSSGGASSALAAGLCAIAQGSDGGGSIRGPASCCGLVGLKPSRGRVSAAPIGYRQGSISTGGPLARTVADAAAFLDVTAGYVTGDPYWLPDPMPSFLDSARNYEQTMAGRSLRIAFATGVTPIGDADAVCQAAVLETAKRLEDLGHQVIPDRLDCNGLIEPFSTVFRAGVGAADLPPEALNPVNRWFLEQAVSSGKYLKALWEMQAIARQLVARFDTYDVMVLPIYLHSTIRIGEWAHLSPEETFQQIVKWVTPCPPFNATGQPAIAIPGGFDPNGLPVGVQLVGRPAAESTIIALAAQLEAAHPWHHHRPTIATAQSAPGRAID